MGKGDITPIAQVFWSKSGLAAARPAAAGLRNGSLWFSTDTKDIDQVQGGAWVTVLDYSAFGANLAAHAALPTVHQNAPALILTHTALATAHQDAPALIATHAAISDAHHSVMTEAAVKVVIGSFWAATLAQFQATPATGTFGNFPEAINDNNTANQALADVVDQYSEVDFGAEVFIRRWRQYGRTGQAEDGVWKIQYWNLITSAWVDWVTGIATRTTESWSEFTTESTQLTSKIRLVATTLDTGDNRNEIRELEVIY